MNIQRKKLAFAIMAVLLGSAPFALHAETQTDDETINNAHPDIDLNDTDTNEADWQICIDSGCNGGSVVGINEGFHIVSDESGTGLGSIALQIENGAGAPSVPAVTIDSSGRVGIGNENPAEDLNITSGFPDVRMDDTGGGRVDFNMNGNLFWLENATDHDVFQMATNGGAAQTGQLVLDSDGDVGIQITNPRYDLTVGGDGIILMQNPSSTTNDWGFWSGSSGMWVSRGNNRIDNIADNHVLKLENSAPTNSLVLNSTGMGVGTASPTADLHVRKSSANAIIEDTNAVTAQRFQMELKNKGSAGFLVTDTSVAGRQWQFASQPNGAFAMSKIGTGGPEFQIGQDGAFQVGPGALVNLALGATGALTLLNGPVTATNFITSSSRTVKKDFKKIDSSEIMEKLKKVEVSEWSYIDEDAKGRHLGPMAEEFYALFELGPDDKHVTATDMASVAIVAAKELQAKSSQYEREIATLGSENTELKQRLESLEKLVTQLASGDGFLPNTGKTVAMKK